MAEQLGSGHFYGAAAAADDEHSGQFDWAGELVDIDIIHPAGLPQLPYLLWLPPIHWVFSSAVDAATDANRTTNCKCGATTAGGTGLSVSRNSGGASATTTTTTTTTTNFRHFPRVLQPKCE